MNKFTFEQQKAIQAWTDQRDTLLRDIGNSSTQLEALQKSTKEQGLALADLHNSISEARGRIAEITALEERMKGSLSAEVAELEVRKSRLEGECLALVQKVDVAIATHEAVVGSTQLLQSAHDTMKDQAAIVNKVVGEVIETSQTHTSEMKTVMSEIRTVSNEVIEKSKENIKTADITLNKLTMYIVDSQRPIPVRRTYPEGHPRLIMEEQKS